jgi:ribosomal biogenesis protein LAS1
MYETAKEIGMPSEFVDVRHECTHGELPSLRRLQSCAKDALHWLWESYWSNLGVPSTEHSGERTEPMSHEREIRLSESLHDALKRYLKSRRIAIKGSERDKDNNGDDAIQECVSLCKVEPTALQRLVFKLVKEKMITPSNRKQVISGFQTHLIWSELRR